MPQEWNNAGMALATTTATAYTCPSGRTAIVMGLHVANTNGAASATGIGVQWRDSSAAVTHALIFALAVPQGEAVDIIAGQQLVLRENDYIEAWCDSGNDADITVSVVEIY